MITHRRVQHVEKCNCGNWRPTLPKDLGAT
jgi:hypothetical protein